MDKSTVTVFDNINGEIRRRNISQQTLCEYLGIDRRKYSYWQKRGDMPTSFFIKCALFLNCSLEYLSRDVNPINKTTEEKAG